MGVPSRNGGKAQCTRCHGDEDLEEGTFRVAVSDGGRDGRKPFLWISLPRIRSMQAPAVRQLHIPNAHFVQSSCSGESLRRFSKRVCAELQEHEPSDHQSRQECSCTL